ncbi:MAG: hypothetical protein JOZ90_04615 [Alphaproteobacteria bacterium]|nr:hypothetical protein [Alphaproteobacteria bacterium]MBV9371646.1 hypothetical protein [Alphaproteobacteria bacterium]MBV9900363.1 hypothetical protein [Alphaproteobacteria bacterium]
MIARGFKSVIWVATVGGAALCCYMVSLRVATERADLAKVESQIIAAKRDIRSLQTELGTRGRLTQLDQWNSDVLALSAPTSAQFVKDDVALARLERRDSTVADQAQNVRMASAEVAPAPQRAQPAPRVLPAIAPAPAAPPPMVRRASYTPGDVAVPARPARAPDKPASIAPRPTKPGKDEMAAAAAKPAKPTPAKPRPAKPTAVVAAAAAPPAAAKPATAKPSPAKPAPLKPALVTAAAEPRRTATAVKPATAKPAPPSRTATRAPGGEAHR